ncbi:leucine-rich repeat-containing protein 4C-like [Saccostrea echinata]|uniref:leucine-rich repeat-containing protein 4C-like n=1 Tax=Saccostrea echinata TaxID=191078 RepID=UPI002A8321C6|nr:leucine-rich repeat-containing protein 4C-like [Saccostrea echinata]
MSLISVLVVLAVCSRVYGNPQGCSYDSSQLLHTCNARAWSLPLAFGTFSPQPQRILLREVDGELPNGTPTGPTFSGFSSISTASFDSNYAPELIIRCTSNGQLIITQAAFADMGWVEELTIEDCDILSLPVQVFSNFGNLNRFAIIGGSIDAMVGDSFTGMNVEKMTTVPDPRGEFVIKNSRLVSGGFAFGALFSQSNVTSVIIENANLKSIQTDMFYALQKMTYLSLSNNPFTYLPTDLFKGINSLTTVELYGIPWACTCTNIWPPSWLESNNITMNGDAVCGSPTAYENVKMSLYDKEQCPQPDACEKAGQTGFVVGSICMTILDIVNYALLFATFVLSLVALGLVIHTKRQVGSAKDSKQKGKPNAKGSGLRRSSTSWNKVDDAQNVPT